jgi:endonuclease/exonuclease/phosphatase (EEP) superfamily protein YafD
MITLLFWNVGAASRPIQISDLATRYDVDVVLLAELVDEPSELLLALNKTVVAYSYAPGIGNTKIHIFARFSETFAAPIYETDRLTVRRLNPPGIEEILLAVVHFPSKYAWSDDSQTMECTRLADDIRRIEESTGHQKTVLVGDFNMNPFETGVVSAAGMHAVMDRKVAQRGNRIVQEREYPFFYNPMWSLFGDATRGPAGTFYHPRAEHKVYFWNMFDQVLVRPALLERFRFDDLAIIDHTGEQSLLTDTGIPDRKLGSDHLPILFRLSL